MRDFIMYELGLGELMEMIFFDRMKMLGDG